MCLNVPFIILGREVNDFVSSGFLILYPREQLTFYILCFFKYISIGNGFEVISSQINEDVRNNPWKLWKSWFRNYLQETFYKNNHVRQNTSVPTRRANTIDSIFVGNYARSSQLFETGFRGLTITSLGNALAKRRIKSNPLQITITPKPNTSSIILKILIQDKMPSTSFNVSRRVELHSPFFDHYLFFYSNYHAPNRSFIHWINLQIRL